MTTGSVGCRASSSRACPNSSPPDGPGIENDEIDGPLADGEQQRAPAIDDREGVFSREGDVELGGEWGREAGEDFQFGGRRILS